jgi:DedD protein
MARPTGDEELQLRKRARRRLIGAIVLVMVVVLVLPMVLDTEPRPSSQDIDIRIPSPDAGTFKSKIVPIAPGPDAKPPAKADVGAASKAGQSAQRASAPADATKSVAKAEAPKPEATITESAAGQHVVQVAALLNAERAAGINERIQAAGIKSYTEVVKTAKGDVTRVRAGPFPTSEAAESARKQIQRIEFEGRKLDGKVIPVK